MDIARQVASFIRDTLGCGCPPEVVQDFRLGVENEPAPRRLRIEVGERLLVLILDPEDFGGLPASAAALASAAAAERRQRGFNRVRIVVPQPPGAALGGELQQAVQRATRGEPVLLHVLPRAALEPVLALGRRSLGQAPGQ